MKGTGAEVLMEEGALKALRATLLSQLKIKFRTLPEGVVLAVNCCADRARVEGWLVRILTASTLEEMGIED